MKGARTGEHHEDVLPVARMQTGGWFLTFWAHGFPLSAAICGRLCAQLCAQIREQPTPPVYGLDGGLGGGAGNGLGTAAGTGTNGWVQGPGMGGGHRGGACTCALLTAGRLRPCAEPLFRLLRSVSTPFLASRRDQGGESHARGGDKTVSRSREMAGDTEEWVVRGG